MWEMITNVGGVTVLIIVVFASLRTILDIMDSFSFLPKKIANLTKRKRKREITEFLNETGLLEHFRNLNDLSRKIKVQQSGLVKSDDILPGIKYFIRESIEKGNFQIASATKTEVEYFINLRGLYLNNSEALEKISTLFASYIYHICESKKIDYEYVVFPSGSSSILGYYSSKILSKPILFKDDKMNTKVNGNSWRIAGLPTGQTIKDKKCIIVDESFVNGASILSTYKAIIESGGQCNNVFSVFSRKEGSHDHYTELADNVNFHIIQSYSNTDLKNEFKTKSA